MNRTEGQKRDEQLGINYIRKCMLKSLQNITSNTDDVATETTLQGILSAVDNMRDYEVRLVVDSAGTPVTWLEVRYWDAQSGALGTPLYYLPGSTTPGTPTGAISYVNSNTLLSQIQAELLAQTALITTSNTKQDAIIQLEKDAQGGNGTEYIYAPSVVTGKNYKYLVANEDVTFTTLVGSTTPDLLAALPTGLGITTNSVKKGMIIKGKNGETITAVTPATGSVIGIV